MADFSRILAGPLCSMLLADAGARVIKIEEPGRGDETRRWGPPFIGDESAYFLSVNRNKESLTLNLKTRKGLEIAKRLIRRADVVIENFRAAQRRDFRLAYSSVRRVNSRAIVCSITGFERDSPEAGLPGYDLLAQASGGLMWITGEPEGDPTKVGVALSDVLTAHFAFGAIVSALYARKRSGKGTSIEVSLFGSTLSSLVNVAQNYLVTGEEAKRYGNAHPSIVPYQAFHGSDRLFVIAVATDRHFGLLCEKLLGRADLARDPRYRTNADRVHNRERLIAKLELIFGRRPAAEWVRGCRREGIPATIVAGVGEALSRSSLVETVKHATIGDIPFVRNPLLLGARRSAIRTAPPILGQHTTEILTELGYSKSDLSEFRTSGVI